MEFVGGGELYDCIVGRSRFSELECFDVVYPILKGIRYLHMLGIVHRDIKPENILCGNTASDIKICDFGLSKFVLPSERMKIPCGTLAYLAPEIISETGYGKGADMWSLGIVVYLLLRGKLPFSGSTKAKFVSDMRSRPLKLSDDVWKTISPDTIDFVSQLLKKNPKERITSKAALRHAWIHRMLSEKSNTKRKATFLRPACLMRNRSAPP